VARDVDLARIVDRWGLPPLWSRPPGFATLTFIVLEQQVSLASARATFDRLRSAIGDPAPDGFLQLDDAALLRIGFSRQKAGYVRGLARAVLDGTLDLEAVADLPDETVREVLVAHKGIGPWTADVYLLLVLLRPDVWPVSDLALVTAVQSAKGLSNRPSADEMVALGDAWRPWRSVAARLFWHDYLSRRGQRDEGVPA
jgi:DNA-3-methyladenine glycosylase II